MFEHSETLEKRDSQKLAAFQMVPPEELHGNNPDVDRILSYLHTKTEGKRHVKRSDINPADLKGLLPGICFFVPQYDENGALEDVTIRLQGTRAVNFYGELTGKSVRDHPSPEVSQRIIACIQASLDRRGPIVGIAETLSAEQSFLSVKVLYVPMSEDGDHIDRFLVYIEVVQKPIFQRPQ